MISWQHNALARRRKRIVPATLHSMFDKKQQLKKPKKEKKGPTRKEERQVEHHRRYEEEDAPVYDQVKERAFDWTLGTYCCEYCHKAIGDHGAMHHIPPRSRGGRTTLETVFYVCVPCHDAWHQGRWKTIEDHPILR